MSDVQSRPSAPRGRGSSRGARSGYSSRGGPRGGTRQKSNGEKVDHQSSMPEDEGEIGELKRKYGTQLATLKELFPDWTDEDLVYPLEEAGGDLESTIDRISEGNVSQWGKVEKKSKERARSKAHDPASATAADSASTGRGGRGGRGGHEGAGRTGDRGRGSGRGGRGGSTAARGSRATNAHGSGPDGAKASVPTEDSWTWDGEQPKSTAQTSNGGWDNSAAAQTPGSGGSSAAAASGDTPSASETSPGVAIPSGPKKTWASMFAKPTPPPAAKVVPPPAAPAQDEAPAAEAREPEPEALPPPPAAADAMVTPADESPAPPVGDGPEPTLEPPKDKLTESNLEQVLDTSIPPGSNTQASTVATSQITPSHTGTGTPYSGAGQLPASRPPMGGYASSAYRATGAPGRSASFQRRVLDQQEAVVMPNNHAVDRAAVQFGSMGLNGVGDEQDVDEDREEAETRAQPPQHSPVAHPVASLPPAPRQGLPSQQQPPSRDAEPTPRQAPGLPVAPSQQQQQQPPQPQLQGAPQSTASEGSTVPQSVAPDPQPGSHPYGQFNRYAQPATQHDQPSTAQKAFDPFGHQTSQAQTQQNHYDAYASHAQTQQGQGQSQPGSHIGASSAANNYSSYYTSDHQSRTGYPNYYSAMYGGQQSGQTPQEAGAGQQRPGSGLSQSVADSSLYPTSQAPSRYGQVAESQASGGSTPNPSVVGQHGQQTQANQSQPSQPMQGQQPQTQAAGHTGFPYGNPYYSNPYYAAYMNSFNYGQSYGAPFGGKAGHYAQPSQGYGISPQSSYEHSSSPVNVGGYGPASVHGREGALGGAVNDYGRSSSAQAGPNQTQSGASGAFGGIPDVFGRSGFQGHNQPLGQHHGNAQSAAEDSLKAFGENKATAGPSPSMNHTAGGRTETANHNNSNNGPTAHQTGTGLPPSQTQQTQPGYGGYPGGHLNPHHHLHHGSQTGQYGGLGGLGGHPAGGQSHQGGAGYGSYPSGYGGNYYASSGRGGGWGGNYGH